jgi:hypothetical protein
MTIPDWTEASCAATHYDCQADVFCNIGGWWHKGTFIYEDNNGWGTNRYTPRPAEPDKPTEWDGTGLPQVGEVCKYDWTESGFFSTAIVRYRGDKLIIVSCEGSERVVYVEDAAEQLRPIRTHAQNEREELEDLLKGAIALDFSVQTMVSCIIARGYRLER